MQRFLRGALFPVAFLLFWEFATRAGWLRYDSLSWPTAIARAGWTALLDGSILLSTWETCQSALLGLAIGAAIGILLGAILGLWTPIARMAGPTFDASLLTMMGLSAAAYVGLKVPEQSSPPAGADPKAGYAAAPTSALPPVIRPQ